MASTRTTYAYIEKFEQQSVGWDMGTPLDTIDQGISVHYNLASEAISAFELVGFDPASDNQIRLAQVASTHKVASGIALAAIEAGESGQWLSRGFVQNAGWSFTKGDIVYLTTTAGGLAVAGTTHVATSGDQLILQPVGIATSATRVFFDFTRRATFPYTIPADGYTVVSGTVAESFASVSGPGSIRKLNVTSGGGVIVFGFRLPGWFRAIPAIAGVWGFRIGYLATSTGTIDVTNIYDGAGNSGDPAISAGTSTSWANLDVDWDDMAGISGISYGAGDSVYVEVTTATEAVDMEAVPALRFDPMPLLF